jgi:DNA-binding response OmpR family regulator
MNRVLIIEDDADIALSIRYAMERDGSHAVTVAADGEAGLAEARRSLPDLILLDLNLPGMDGTEVCRQLRRDAATGGIPIVMLTARAQEQDRVSGLDLGADDYVTKPFSLKELLARIRAVLRRAAPRVDTASPVVVAGTLRLDETRRRVAVDGQEVQLTRKEFDLLADLMRRPGLIRTRDQLLSRVWGYDYPGATRTVDVHVRQLRKKLGPRVAAAIETVIGFGYRFRDGET